MSPVNKEGFNYSKGSGSQGIPEGSKTSCVDEANKKIEVVLKILFEDQEEFNSSLLVAQLKVFAEDDSIRIPYYQVTTHVNKVLDGCNDRKEQDFRIDSARQRLKQITLDPMFHGDDNFGKLTIKILDHIDLAEHQYASLTNNIKRIEEQLNEKMKKIGDDVNKTEDQINSIYSQIISIIGIFTGIAFILFGGVSALNGIKDAVQTNGAAFLRVMAYASVIGAFVIGAVLLFFRFVLVLTRKSVSSKEWTIKNGIFTFWILVGMAIVFSGVSLWFHYTDQEKTQNEAISRQIIETQSTYEEPNLVQDKFSS